MSLAKSLPKAPKGDVNARAVAVCPCAVVLWALAGSVSRPARSGSSYGLGTLASKRRNGLPEGPANLKVLCRLFNTAVDSAAVASWKTAHPHVRGPAVCFASSEYGRKGW